MLYISTMRLLYLYSGIRSGLIEKAKRGEDPGDGTWGMLRLRHFGVAAEHLELEQFVPTPFARFLRFRVLGNYGAHLPFFFNFFRYDVVFTAGAFYSQFLFTLARIVLRFKRPLWVMHDFSITGFLGEERSVRQKLFAFLVRRADGIVTVGKEEAAHLAERFPHLTDRIAYIPFGVDTGFFAPRLGVSETRTVLAAGIDPDRDWGTLYRACEGLRAEVIAATRPRGEKDIPVPTFVTRRLFSLKELVEVYARASVVVVPLDPHTGVNDAMGCTALFEAMAMGKAIVATDTHTMRSYITHGENGLLVPPGDVSAMHTAIKDLLDDAGKRAQLGAAARAYALSHLDAEKLAGVLAAYFKGLLSKTGNR